MQDAKSKTTISSSTPNRAEFGVVQNLAGFWTKSKIFLLFCLSFVLGIGIASFAKIPVLIPGFLAVASVIAAAIFWKEKKSVVVASFAILIISSGYFHFYLFRDGFGVSNTPVYRKTAAVLEKVKSQFELSLNSSLPEPEASYSAGILLGSRQKIPKQLKEDFRTTGTTHILAISGYNITVIAGALASVFLILQMSRVAAFWLTMSVLVAFTILTGASPSIIRASIMGMLLLVAQKNGRLYSSINALIFVGALMIFFEPKILRFDLAFQLSFLATLGIIFLFPLLENKFKKIPEFLQLKENFIMTISAQLAVLPLILLKFGSLSIISLAVNTFVLPVIPYSMFFSFVAGTLGLFSGLLGRFFGYFALIPLRYTIKTIELGASIPFASVPMNRIPPFLFILFYAALGWMVWRRYKNKKRNKVLKND